MPITKQCILIVHIFCDRINNIFYNSQFALPDCFAVQWGSILKEDGESKTGLKYDTSNKFLLAKHAEMEMTFFLD